MDYNNGRNRDRSRDLNRDVNRERDRTRERERPRQRDEDDKKQKKGDVRPVSRWSNNSSNLLPKKENTEKKDNEEKSCDKNESSESLEKEKTPHIVQVVNNELSVSEDKNCETTSLLKDANISNRLTKLSNNSNINEGSTTPLYDEPQVAQSTTTNTPVIKQQNIVVVDNNEQNTSESNNLAKYSATNISSELTETSNSNEESKYDKIEKQKDDFCLDPKTVIVHEINKNSKETVILKDLEPKLHFETNYDSSKLPNNKTEPLLETDLTDTTNISCISSETKKETNE